MGLKSRFAALSKLDLLTILALGVMAVLIFRNTRGPELPDEKAPVSHLALISGESFDLAAMPQGTVVVFWATWCPPCKLELARIQRLIEANEIDSSSVVAVSGGEERALVESVVRERKYSFQVGLDPRGELMQKFRVAATPTVFLVKPNLEIVWSSAGISPTLEFRIKSFLHSPSSSGKKDKL